MQRRDLLRLLGGVSVLSGMSATELLALGQKTHQLSTTPLGFFSVHQLHTVAAAGERIIPATDTPGAMAAECHRFAERIVADHYDKDRQHRYINGLIDLDKRASATHQQLFVDLGNDQQDAILESVESDAYSDSDSGSDSFWRDLKHLTVYGYYTSEIGIRQELKTPTVPGYFDGQMPIVETTQ
jgi:gluconate 2-dehydrogenase gamma chain